MAGIAEFMAADHKRLDAAYREFQDIESSDLARAGELFGNFDTKLRRHIAWEEEVLFPLFEERTGNYDHGPTAVMRLEHVEIKAFLEKLAEKLAASQQDTEALERGLQEVLTAHNFKEENILYPTIDGMLTPEDRAEVLAKVAGS